MKKAHLFNLLLAMFSTSIVAQQPEIKYEVEAQAIGTTNSAIPFWMRSNRFGSIPSEGLSGSFITRANKDYDKEKTGMFDWGAGFEGRVNAGQKSKLVLIEGFIKAKAGVFELKVGRSKDVVGLNGDSSLTSGNFAVSGNALGIPKIELSIPNYYSIPILNGLFAFKGTISHGWVGKAQLRDSLGAVKKTDPHIIPQENPITTYTHQKSFYARFGKQDWRLKLYGGFNHNVFWSDESKIYGDLYSLSHLETLFYVITGKAYGGLSNGAPRSKIGNHIGSIDLAFQYDLKNVSLMLYRQNFYEAGALAKLANVKDGLTGVVLTNLVKTSNRFKWEKILFELLYTKDQAGGEPSKHINSGDEDYYNNYLYLQGWSYKGLGLGNPFLTPKDKARNNLPREPYAFFVNNRTIAFHGAITASMQRWRFQSKLSYSKNFGTYGTSIWGKTTGTIVQPPLYGIFQEVKQFSMIIDSKYDLKQGVSLGASVAMDNGKLIRNSTGLLLNITKTF